MIKTSALNQFSTLLFFKRELMISKRSNETSHMLAGLFDTLMASIQGLIIGKSNGSEGKASAWGRFLDLFLSKKCLQSSIHKNGVPRIPAGFFDAQIASTQVIVGD
jgi:hypothetical protein